MWRQRTSYKSYLHSKPHSWEYPKVSFPKNQTLSTFTVHKNSFCSESLNQVSLNAYYLWLECPQTSNGRHYLWCKSLHFLVEELAAIKPPSVLECLDAGLNCSMFACLNLYSGQHFQTQVVAMLLCTMLWEYVGCTMCEILRPWLLRRNDDGIKEWPFYCTYVEPAWLPVDVLLAWLCCNSTYLSPDELLLFQGLFHASSQHNSHILLNWMHIA